MTSTYLPKLLFAAALSAAVLPGAASARIRCDGGFQIVEGQRIATPYCRDENLARVARGYGMRVSGDAMRHSESQKLQVCRFIGHDTRVREACLNYRDEGGSPFRF
jgi:hypothetical protein